MKKIVILGVLICSLLLIVTPSIPAQQYTLVNNAIEKEFENKLDHLRSFLGDGKVSSNVNKLVFSSQTQENQLDFVNSSSSKTFLSNLLISLVLAFFGTVFGIFFGPLLALIIKIVTWPAVKLADLISSLFSEDLIEVTTI